jgi:hypothetical protein
MTLDASAQKGVHYRLQIGFYTRLIVREAILFPSPSIDELRTELDQAAKVAQRNIGALERILNRCGSWAVSNDLVAHVEGLIVPELLDARQLSLLDLFEVWRSF